MSIFGEGIVTGHRVSGGPIHTAIEYVNSEGKSDWLSAGPVGLNNTVKSIEGLEYLVGGGSRTRFTDKPGYNDVLGNVTAPSGFTNDEYFDLLTDTASTFCNTCVDYDLFPSVSDGYNSNSYVNTLISMTGGRTDINLGDYVGGGKVIPSSHF